MKLWANHKLIVGRTISSVNQDDDLIILHFTDGGYVSLRQNKGGLQEDFGDGPKQILALKTWDIEEHEPAKT